MSSNSPFKAGDRVKVSEREITGRVSDHLSWTGKVVSVNFPWIRVRDEGGTIYERHASTLRAVETHAGRTRMTTVGGQIAVLAPARERARVEFEMPEMKTRRKRKGPSEIEGSGVAIAPMTRGRRKSASRLSELEAPSAEEKAAAKAFVIARREANAKARKQKERAARLAAADGDKATPPATSKKRATKSTTPSRGAKSSRASSKRAADVVTKKLATKAPATVPTQTASVAKRTMTAKPSKSASTARGASTAKRAKARIAKRARGNSQPSKRKAATAAKQAATRTRSRSLATGPKQPSRTVPARPAPVRVTGKQEAVGGSRASRKAASPDVAPRGASKVSPKRQTALRTPSSSRGDDFVTKATKSAAEKSSKRSHARKKNSGTNSVDAERGSRRTTPATAGAPVETAQLSLQIPPARKRRNR